MASREENIEEIDITNYPITTNAFTWTKAGIILYLLLHCLSLIIPSVMIITFHSYALSSNLYTHGWRVPFVIIDIMVWWGLYIIMSLFLGKLVLILLELMHKPKEGLFKMDKKDRDYYFFCLRVTVKKYIFWVWNNWCFPWASGMAYRVCNMTKDFKSTMFDGWSDVEFIEYGKNIMLGQGAVVLSSMIIGDHLLIRKVVIGDHCVIGGNAIVAPGTVMGKGTTLGVWATTHINQVLEPEWIYIGRPARKYKSAQTMFEESKKQPMRRFVDTGERKPHTINRIVRKGKIEIVLDDLDTLYTEWKKHRIIKTKAKRKKKDASMGLEQK